MVYAGTYVGAYHVLMCTVLPPGLIDSMGIHAFMCASPNRFIFIQITYVRICPYSSVCLHVRTYDRYTYVRMSIRVYRHLYVCKVSSSLRNCSPLRTLCLSCMYSERALCISICYSLCPPVFPPYRGFM